MADACERFCGRWYRNRDCYRLLVIAGQTGQGKTHAMRGVHRFARGAAEPAAAAGFWKWPPVVLWSDWPTLARRISERDAPMWDVLYDSNEADLLFLDDIGAESDKYKTGEASDALCQLLSRRAGKWTMVSTNIDPMSWATRFDVRVADRLNRGSEIIRLTAMGSYATVRAA